MSQTKVSKTYAKSLLDLAVEKGVLEQVKADMELVFATCSESKDLQLLLSSPIVNTQAKTTILSQLFSTKVNAHTYSFIELLTKKGREDQIGDIAESFASLYLNHKNILKAVIVSVDGVGESLKQKVKELVSATYQKEVLIEEVKNPSLLGGFVITVGDKQIDASVSKQLALLKNTFSENPYISHL